jgi:Family of unknown function (DUF5677)
VNQKHSILEDELRRRAKEALAANSFKQEPDLEEIIHNIIHDPDIAPREVKAEVAENVKNIALDRERQCHDMADRIANRHGSCFDQLDRCLAFGDYINRRLAKVVFRNGDSLRSKEPRPRKEYITGAVLQCLLLLTLQAKVCAIATEISCLLKNGFGDGALSRLRSIYEHTVIISLIALDDTYIVSERYQDYACFEELLRLRTVKDSLVDPETPGQRDPTTDAELDTAISELEAAAQAHRALWGPNISHANEWARPILPIAKQGKARISFSDLEEVAAMQRYRWVYLGGNQRVHAGAFATINHMNYESRDISDLYPAHGKWDDHDVTATGWWTVTLIERATYLVARTVASETGEIDELLYFSAMTSLIDEVLEQFRLADS